MPTSDTLELFAYRLYECDRTCDVNIKAQKTPVLLLCDDKQRFSLEQLYVQYNGNQPVIFGDKNQLGVGTIQAINTQAPFVCDKILDYKRQIWNEALTFLGINTLQQDKRERLLTDEVESNNELINLNLQSYLAPRQKACEQFNKLFGLEGTKDAISVKVRSDLFNIVKTEQSAIISNNPKNLENNKKEGGENG